MPSLQFDGVDDYIGFTGLSTAMQNLATGAYTVAFLMERDNWGRSWDTIWSLRTTPNQTTTFDLTASAEWQGGNTLTMQDDGNNKNWAHGLVVRTDHPMLVVYSKAAGVATFEASIFDIDAATWVGGSPAAASDDSFAVPSTGGLEFGTWFGTDAFFGRLGIFAAWNVYMDQTAREECGATLATSGLWGHSAGQPACLIEFTTTSPTDLAGGVSSIVASSAPTVAADELGWTYDGIGAAGPLERTLSYTAVGGYSGSTVLTALRALAYSAGGAYTRVAQPAKTLSYTAAGAYARAASAAKTLAYDATGTAAQTKRAAKTLAYSAAGAASAATAATVQLALRYAAGAAYAPVKTAQKALAYTAAGVAQAPGLGSIVQLVLTYTAGPAAYATQAVMALPTTLRRYPRNVRAHIRPPTGLRRRRKNR